MSKLFNSKAKLLYLGFILVFVLVVVLALYYMTNYADIHVFYTIGKNGMEFGKEGISIGGSGNKAYDNTYLLDFFNYANHGYEYADFTAYAKKIYSFQTLINDYNDLIIAFAAVGFICYIVFIIFSNHNRNVYYKSNLVVGLVVPVILIAFSVVMIVKNLEIMEEFTSNEEFYKTVALMQGSYIDGQLKDRFIDGAETYQNLKKYVSEINTTTFIIATVTYVLVALYSALIMVYTVIRYKSSTKRRNEILERAAQQHD
ncbi:MAG: hypothetical protein IJA65_00010 [Acholeplasmatales bacterium]|nr:hypothetical protein [Acholeplasmatales bacterium]